MHDQGQSNREKTAVIVMRQKAPGTCQNEQLIAKKTKEEGQTNEWDSVRASDIELDDYGVLLVSSKRVVWLSV
jgi:hypothetical protein